MPTEETVNHFWKDSLAIVINSTVALLCTFLFFAEGILVLNMVVSFRRKNRNFIYNPLMTIPIGLAESSIIFFCLNYNTIITNSLTVEIIKSNILSSAILTLAITGVISMIVYIIKENLFIRGKKNDE